MKTKKGLTPLNEIEGVMKPFIVKYGYSKQDLIFPNGEHVFFKTLRDASRTLRAVNAYLPVLDLLKEMAHIGFFDEAEGPELRAQNASLHSLAKQAIDKAEGKWE